MRPSRELPIDLLQRPAQPCGIAGRRCRKAGAHAGAQVSEAGWSSRIARQRTRLGDQIVFVAGNPIVEARRAQKGRARAGDPPVADTGQDGNALPQGLGRGAPTRQIAVVRRRADAANRNIDAVSQALAAAYR